jgi:hypothetical protein
MIFAQLARKECEQAVNTSDRRSLRAPALQRRSSKAIIVILRTGKPGANEARDNVACGRTMFDLCTGN